MATHRLLTKQVLLAKYTSNFVATEDFKVVDSLVDAEPQPNDILFKTVFISVDPWYRLRMHETTQGLEVPPFQIGQPLAVGLVAKVVSSKNPSYEVGNFVTGIGIASGYAIASGGKDFFGVPYRKIDARLAPLRDYLGPLGMPGFTAWIGIIRLGQAKAGEEVFISAAAGGVGLAAGQIAKSKGCRVVGSAGSDEKVRALKEEFGFDDAFNYKAEADWTSTLNRCARARERERERERERDGFVSRLFPRGIDIYLENVGGKMLEAVLNNINLHARIVVSGMISQYNKDWRTADGVRNLMNLVGKCAKIEGFLAYNYMEHLKTFEEDMHKAIQEGKLVSKDTLICGIENFPSAFVGIMEGKNIGKAIVQVAEP